MIEDRTVQLLFLQGSISKGTMRWPVVSACFIGRNAQIVNNEVHNERENIGFGHDHVVYPTVVEQDQPRGATTGCVRAENIYHAYPTASNYH